MERSAIKQKTPDSPSTGSCVRVHRAYILYIEFVGTTCCERKVPGKGMRLPATKSGGCLAQRPISSVRLLITSLE
jgi:hypothetical protein